MLLLLENPWEGCAIIHPHHNYAVLWFAPIGTTWVQFQGIPYRQLEYMSKVDFHIACDNQMWVLLLIHETSFFTRPIWRLSSSYISHTPPPPPLKNTQLLLQYSWMDQVRTLFLQQRDLWRHWLSRDVTVANISLKKLYRQFIFMFPHTPSIRALHSWLVPHWLLFIVNEVWLIWLSGIMQLLLVADAWITLPMYSIIMFAHSYTRWPILLSHSS